MTYSYSLFVLQRDKKIFINQFKKNYPSIHSSVSYGCLHLPKYYLAVISEFVPKVTVDIGFRVNCVHVQQIYSVKCIIL